MDWTEPTKSTDNRSARDMVRDRLLSIYCEVIDLVEKGQNEEHIQNRMNDLSRWIKLYSQVANH